MEAVYDVSEYDIPVVDEVYPAEVAPAEVDPSEEDPSAVTKKRYGRFKSKKRPAAPLSEAETAELQIKRIRLRVASLQHGQTSAVALLNEYQMIDKELKFEVVSSPTVLTHCPVFSVRYTHNGQVFDGTANSKKKAKQIAAEAALRALFDVPSSEADVTEPADASDPQLPHFSCAAVLARLRPKTTYESIESDSVELDAANVGNHAHFRISCVVDGITFVGEGFNKKMARARAAADALEKVFGISCTEISCGLPVFFGELPPITKNEAKPSESVQKPEIVPPQLLFSLPGEKHPLMFMHELYPTAEYTVTVEGGVFHTTVPIEGKTFEGLGCTKKASRLAAAIMALNYLHQTGHLNMRMAEKSSNKKLKPKWQPPQRASFSLESNGNTRGGRGGRGRGRGFKSAFYTDMAKDASWVAGGILKAGDFIGFKSSNANTAHVGSMHNSQQVTDDTYMAANSSFGYDSSYGFQDQGSYQMGSSNTTGVQGSSSYSFYTSDQALSGSFGTQSGTVRGGIGSTRGARGTQRGTPSLNWKGRGASQAGSLTTGLQYSSTKPSAAAGIRLAQPKASAPAVTANATVKRLMHLSGGYNSNSGKGFGTGKSAVVGTKQTSVNPIASNLIQLASAGSYSAGNIGVVQPSTAALYPSYDYAYADYGQALDGSGEHQSMDYLSFGQSGQDQVVEYPSYEHYGEQYYEGGYTM